MFKKWIAAALVLLAVASATGLHLSTAQEPPTQGVRASPKLIREHLEDHPVLTATAVHSVGRSIQDLRALAVDLEQAGQRAESTRLTNAVNEIVRRAELQLADKKAQVAALNAEIEDLKRAIGE